MNIRLDTTAALAVIAGLALSLSTPVVAQQAGNVAEPSAEPPPAATAAAAPSAATAAKKAPAPAPKSLATWRGKVIAHLNSRKRDFGGGAGTATVAFKIDRSGKVMSAKVVTSSGNKALDAEAVALTERASPVPPPPNDVPGASLYLKVPVRFTR